MKPNRLACAAIVLAGGTFLFAGPGFAQTPHPHTTGHSGGPSMGGHPNFRSGPHFSFAHRDFGHFSPAEHRAWVGGRWNHGWHNGRFGWWWYAGGAWYFYDTPIYPYPAYVSDYYAYDEYGAPGQYWYYCASPPGYYPYVQNCSVPWQPVPPSPPQGPGYGPPQGGYSDQGGPPPGYQGGPGPGDQPPPGYQGQDVGPGPGDQPPPGYQSGPGPGPQGYQGPPGGPGPGDQPPPGYQGQDGGPAPGDEPPPGYQGGPGGDQPPPGYQGGPGPGDQGPPGYPPPGPGQNQPPPNGGPDGSH